MMCRVIKHCLIETQRFTKKVASSRKLELYEDYEEISMRKTMRRSS